MRKEANAYKFGKMQTPMKGYVFYNTGHLPNDKKIPR